MEINEFKEELNNIKVKDDKWKEKMMMVTKLYKSLGYNLNDFMNDENILINKIYFYIPMLLNNIIEPGTQTFYSYVLVEQEASDTKNIKSKLTNDRIRKMLFRDDTNQREYANEDDKFINTFYDNIGINTVKNLIRDTNFIKGMLKHIKINPNFESVQDMFNQNSNAGIESIYNFISENSEGKKLFMEAYIKEFTDYEKKLKKEMKINLINRITYITSFFEQCGYLEEMMEINNSVMKKNNIPMIVSKEDNKADFNLMNLTSEKYFEQFSIEELFVFSAHYTNRFEKIANNINDGIYLHQKLGTFYDSLAYEEIPKEITYDDAKVVLKQKKFIESLSRGEFKALKDSVTSETKVDDLDFSYVPEEFIKQYGEAYNEYFGRYITKTDNKLEDDYRFIFSNRSMSYCMYAIKDFSIDSLLFTLCFSNTKMNYGIIKDNKVKENEYGEEQILLGVDYKELSSIRLHFPKEDFDDFLDKFMLHDVFPDYKGNGDFLINGTEIKTQILYKFTKKQKQAIKREMEEELKLRGETDRYRFLRHMYRNIHPNKNVEKNNKKELYDID